MMVVPQRGKHKFAGDAKPAWNTAGYPTWHPSLLLDLLIAALIYPGWLDALLSDEYTRHEISRSGKWLCLLLIGTPLLFLWAALDFNYGHWLLLVDVRGLTALFLWALTFGAAAALSVIAHQPVMFFLATMAAFFAGLVVGMLSLLVVEVWLRQCYKWRRPWLGRLNIVLLIVTQAAGLLMVRGYAF